MANITVKTSNHISTDFTWSEKLQFFFILNGFVHMQVNSDNYVLNKNDFFFIKPYEFYCCLNSDDSCKYFIVEVPLEIIESACPDFRLYTFANRFIRSGNEDASYNEICSNLASIALNNFEKPSDNLLKYRCVLNITEIIIRNFLVTLEQENDIVKEKESQQIFSIFHYIEDHYAENFSLSDISKACHFHPQYFSVYFKKKFKTNFTDFLNSFRVNKSISLLNSGKKSILDVALAVGFNNHKTYSSAFKKQYNLTPGQFRQRLKLNPISNDDVNINETDFEDLLNFANKEKNYSVFSNIPRKIKNISFSYDDSVCINNKMLKGITVGRAISCLRQEVQNQLSKVIKTMPLDFIRIRDIFSDDMFVYYEDADKNQSYSWKYIDEILDYILSLNIIPFIEIGYMPSQLASKKQYAGWQYHPNISYPKSIEKWMLLISKFIEHLNIRYGKQQVHTWIFDFWTSPNLNLSDGYWRESKEKFFTFYEATYNAIKRTDPEIFFGTPNFSYPSGLLWYKDFLDFAYQKNLSPSFIGVHLYNCGDGLGDNKQDFMRYTSYDENQEVFDFRPEMNVISDSLLTVYKLIKESPFPDLKIIVDDWSLTFNPTDYLRDTCFMAPYICKTFFDISPNLLAGSFTSLSDINEEYYSTDKMFPGGQGLFEYHGIPKASFFGLVYSYRFSKNILQSENNYIIGKTHDGFEILLYNTGTGGRNEILDKYALPSYNNRYSTFTKSGVMDFNIVARLRPGTYSITINRLNRNVGSSYDLWQKMGSPKRPDREIVDYLKHTSAPSITYRQERTQNYIYINETVDPFGISYISIKML